MNKTKIENNKVTLSGEIVSNFEFSHEAFGEGFYIAMLETERLSGVKDIIPLMISNRLTDIRNLTGQYIKISGQFRSYNQHEENRNRLLLSVLVRKFEILNQRPEKEIPWASDENKIYLEGYICKPTIYRETPLGRGITDVLLAVNRSYGKSDYIPCICWGRNARFADQFEVGSHIQLWGRIQSREYKKQVDGEYETRVAYEVSTNKITEVEEK